MNVPEKELKVNASNPQIVIHDGQIFSTPQSPNSGEGQRFSNALYDKIQKTQAARN